MRCPSSRTSNQLRVTDQSLPKHTIHGRLASILRRAGARGLPEHQCGPGEFLVRGSAQSGAPSKVCYWRNRRTCGALAPKVVGLPGRTSGAGEQNGTRANLTEAGVVCRSLTCASCAKSRLTTRSLVMAGVRGKGGEWSRFFYGPR